MKAKIKQNFKYYMSYVLVFMVILLVVLKTVNFHRDGSTLVNGSYALYISNSEYNLDVERAELLPGTNVRFWKVNKGSNRQHFYLSYQGDGIYHIEFEGARIGVEKNGNNIEIQKTDNMELQKWTIERIESSYYYWITNVATGMAMCYEEGQDNSINAKVDVLDKNNDHFKIRIQ